MFLSDVGSTDNDSSCLSQEKYVRTLLNFGVSPVNNQTIIPRSVFDEITTAHAITEGNPKSSDMSIEGYGLGWRRGSYLGKDVRRQTPA